MRATQRYAFIASQWALAAIVVWYAIRSLDGQWRQAAAGLRSLDIGWTWITAATLVVLLTYVLLIDTWRRILTAWSAYLPFSVAARIWFVSNLGKYIPGKVWSIAAMSMMARDNSISAVAAAGSSILIQVVSIAAGIGVVLASGATALDRPLLALLAGLAMLVAVGATPFVLPAIVRRLATLVGREVTMPPIDSSVVWLAFLRAAVSWIAYGIAFQIFVRGLLGEAAGATSSYIAVYAASYIIGFLALFSPGGAVVREGAMVAALLRFGLTTQSDALTLAIATRLWLTVLELIPGFAYLVTGRQRSRSTS